VSKTTTNRCQNSESPLPHSVASDLELFHSIVLGIIQAKQMNVLLPMIVSELADTADFALARIWLTETPLTDRQQRVLRLSASAGKSRVERCSWKNLDGEFSSIPWGTLKIGHIAKNSESLHLDEHEIKHSRWTIHPPDTRWCFAGKCWVCLGSSAET
jgi:hypothetical protein